MVILNALKESSIVSLARSYDQNGKGVHLNTFVLFIRENQDVFHVENFKRCLKDNLYVEGLARKNRVPSEEKINEDLKRVSASDPIVKALIKVGDNVIAHKSKDLFVEEKTLGVLQWGSLMSLWSEDLMS